MRVLERNTYADLEDGVWRQEVGVGVEHDRHGNTDIRPRRACDERDELADDEDHQRVEPRLRQVDVQKVPHAAPEAHHRPAVDVQVEARTHKVQNLYV